MTPSAHLGAHGEDLAGGAWGHWNLEPLTVAAMLLLLGAYWVVAARLPAGARRRALGRWRVASFLAGWLALAAALLSPVDPASARLLSAHMLQHVLLVAVAAPLICAGLPLARLGAALPSRLRGLAAAASRTARRGSLAAALALGAVALHAAIVWAWHLPGPYGAALGSEGLHALEHVAFLGSALVAWWAVLAFGARTRPDGAAMAALFLLALQGSVLGAVIAFASSPWYSAYAGPGGAADPLADQQLAGLLMWGFGALAPVIAGAALIVAWLDRLDRRQAASESQPESVAAPPGGVRALNRRASRHRSGEASAPF